ncbi:MAG: hypothetical protein R2850_00750 [Bacteroidia bacterium]
MNTSFTSNNVRTCPRGHKYVKRSDCDSCPKCEALLKPDSGFLSQISAPARRALNNIGITTLEQLAECSENYISNLHGIGKSALKTLNQCLQDSGKSFNKL